MFDNVEDQSLNPCALTTQVLQ